MVLSSTIPLMNTTLTIHTDGGARGNPGPAAIGVVIGQNGETIHEFGKKIGEATNNVAEYTAVIEALQYLIHKGVKRVGEPLSSDWSSALCQNNHTHNNERCLCGRETMIDVSSISGTRTSDRGKPATESFHFFLDSQLVVEQLNGNYKIKNPKLRELSLKIRILEQQVGGVVTYTSIPREQNKRADFLVNQALDN